MSFAIFVSETATVFSAPDASTMPSRAACASNGSAGAEIASPVSSARSARTRAANSGCVFSPVPTAVPPSGIWPSRGSASLTRAIALAHLRRVAAELLAERDGHRVHPVRAAGLDDVVELVRLRLERVREPLERRQQVVRRSRRAPRDGRRTGRRRSTTGPCSRRRSRARPRRRAWRSPRSRSCSTRCRSRSGRRRSGTGRRARRSRCASAAAAMRSALSRSSRPSSAFTRAAAALIRPSQRATGGGIGSPGDGEVGDRLRGFAAPELASAPSCSRRECNARLSAAPAARPRCRA